MVAGHGDQVPLYFYSTLFLAHPETRQMFPTNMAGQRDRLVTALGHIVSNVDQVDRLVGFLQDLGADHRKFAVRAEHYPAVGEALVATLQHFLAEQWTDELAADWTAAYGLVAQVMIEAAQAAEAVNPPWWVAEIVAHERRAFDVAVLTVRPQYLLPFTPVSRSGCRTRRCGRGGTTRRRTRRGRTARWSCMCGPRRVARCRRGWCTGRRWGIGSTWRRRWGTGWGCGRRAPVTCCCWSRAPVGRR